MLAAGDVVVNRAEPASAFALAQHVLDSADILFGNCEAVYSGRAERVPGAGIAVFADQANCRGLGTAGFDVMSCANNHILDGGYSAFGDTLAELRAQGIGVCGAGDDIAGARQPLIVERDGCRFAFLAYSSVFPAGYEAGPGRPGIAVIRVRTAYYPSELELYQSGSPPRTVTVPDPGDLDTMAADIRSAASSADAIIVSLHGGDGSRPVVLLDYEKAIAHAAVDAGASVVLGHHHHIVRGVEVYRGRPIFYGLGHFVFDIPDFNAGVPAGVLEQMREVSGDYAYFERDDYPLLPMHPDARISVLAACVFDGPRLREAGLIPFYLRPSGQPEAVSFDSEDGARVVRYLSSVTRAEGFSTTLEAAVDPASGQPLLSIQLGEAL